jgi:hypothetical protein
MKHPTKESVIHSHWVESLLGPNPSQEDIDEINQACDWHTEDCVWASEFVETRRELAKECNKLGLQAFKAKYKPGWTSYACLVGPGGSANFASLKDARAAASALGLPELEIIKAHNLPRRPEVWGVVILAMESEQKAALFGQAYRDNLRSFYGVQHEED